MNVRFIVIGFLSIVLTTSCVKRDTHTIERIEEYVAAFENRTTVNVNITSEGGERSYFAVYYDNPYDEEMICKLPALEGFTPIVTTLDVPNDVDELYVIGEGDVRRLPVGDVRIASTAYTDSSRASQTNSVSAELITAVNSIYFPERANNVRGDNLFKCTDLKIAETPSTEAFELAEVWLTFLGDGGCRQSDLWGKLWFYTYPSDRMERLTFDDCTFYGVKNDEVVEITFAEMKGGNSWVFNTKEEFASNKSSYKRFKLGEFPKGVNIGFVYKGNSTVENDGYRFTTPQLNVPVENFTLTYSDTKEQYLIKNNHVANGYICHVIAGTIEGNVLGMENRVVTEAKYDGDYNDILCLVESNPKAIEPNEEVEIGNTEDPDRIACKTSSGLYLFEDNYPYQGDFDFNDAVVEYKIKDYYQSSNKSVQVTVRLLAKGAAMNNEFGFRNNGNYISMLKNLDGYSNVNSVSTTDEEEESVTQTLYGTIAPYMRNGLGYYIYKTNYNTDRYPYVLDIPLSDPENADLRFRWMIEGQSIDDGYYFLESPTGGAREKDWYRNPKNESLLY